MTPDKCAAQLLSRRARLGALIALALLLLASPATYAQSGRIKQPSGTKPSSPAATRPKRVGTTNDAPTAQQKPVMRLPSGTVVMDEPPPPPPAPKPTPTPDTSAGEEIDVEDVVRVTSNLVTVPASVVDSQGRAVIDLRLEDFELRVDGQPRPITELSRAEVPVTLALLFDNSQSLSAAREFEKQAAVRFFRSVIRPIDRAAIYSVSTDVVLVQPLTNNVPALVRTIEHFGKPEGATRLLDAIAEAAAYLRPYPGRKVLVIVSDGEDTLSDLDFDGALRKTLAADCQVYAIQTKQIEYMMLTGEKSNANLQALAAERRMQDLTAHTGGAVYTPMQTSDLDRAFAQISADLSQQYILSYYPTDERQDGRFRTISVRVQTRPSMRVRARRGYYPRRSNERISYNMQPPVVAQPNTDAGSYAPQAVSANNTSTLAANITATERAGNIPRRSNRRGPSEAGDEVDASGNAELKTQPDEPIVKRSETTTKPIEKPSPIEKSSPIEKPSPPKAAPDSTPPADSSKATTSAESVKPTAANSSAASSNSKPPAPRTPVSGGVLNGKALHLPRPQYPPNAKSMRTTGVVTVEVLLSEEGKVISARAVDGNPFLRQAAVSAARLARFSPTILSGQPVKVIGVITYKFTLDH